MAFGLAQAKSGDFLDIVKFDARAGRLFRVDFDPATQTKTSVDITNPPPRFAVDFGSLEVGYAQFAATGPDFRLVAEGQPLPAQPQDKDDKGQLAYRAAFRVKLYGKVLDGLREFASSAACVLEAMDELYQRYKRCSEAATGQMPIVELAGAKAVTTGHGARTSTVYAPGFVIVGWTDRAPEMGKRTVPAPLVTQQAEPAPSGNVNTAKPLRAGDLGKAIGDEIPF